MKHNWEYKRLGDVCDILMGQSPSSDSYNDEAKGLPFFQGCSDFGKINPSITKYCSEPIRIANENDILFSVRAPIGTMNIANLTCCIGRGLCSIAIHEPNLQKYLFYALNVSKPKIIEKGTGSTFKAVGKDVLFNHIISVPPREVQERIVAELDKINEVIEDCRELLRNLDALAQSLFYDYFGDPITNPKGWEIKPFKNAVIEMFLGPFGSALKTDSYVSEEESFAMVYEQTHAIKKTLEQENHYIDEEKFFSLKRFEVQPLDFIMSCRGTIGQLYQVPNDSPRGIIHPSVMKIRLNSSTYNSTFFKFLLPIIIKEQQTKGNCVQMAITAKELGSKKLPVPPFELQEEFAERIEKIEAQKKDVEAMIAELQTLLDSRMDYWFN